jgi:hypothetical protein
MLRVRESTEAGKRTVTLLPLLRDELSSLKARRRPERAALVFATPRGGKDSASNVRRPSSPERSSAGTRRSRSATRAASRST